jgi:hypothetical protein
MVECGLLHIRRVPGMLRARCTDGEVASPGYSIVKQERGWSYAAQGITGRDAFIGPFPSQEEAKKDAKESLRTREGEQ